MTLPASAFLTVWTILALNILSPGPNVLNTITAAMGSGRVAGLASAAAVGLGIGLWCLGMALGMTAVFAVVPYAHETLTVMAAVLLIWFASRYIRAGWQGVSGREATLRGVAGLGPRQSFLRSLSINATNPKALTTWIAILGIFPTAEASAGDIALLTLGACLLSLGIHTFYAAIFSTRGAAALYLRAAPLINLGVGVFFLGFAVRLTAPLLARAL
ncbi:LysE family translocator [Palleronia sp. KMU-117]|uniref:LysE family translocator n=1 Tax=Palleronia sp. KMU-117 TaxID=3434108 RepID=UPI003D70C520